MFERSTPSIVSIKETHFFLDWMNQVVLTRENIRQATNVQLEAEQKSPELKKLRTTPQSATYHAEGFIVSDHVLRILSGIYAVVGGADLLSIEEIAREKTFLGELNELQLTIREHAATLIAFALVHDAAKSEVLSFSAPQESKGAQLGFSQHKHRLKELASDRERSEYLKLIRAWTLKNQKISISESMGNFLDSYEIKVHYFGHDRLGASDKYEGIRSNIEEMLNLSPRENRLLQWTIYNHIDFLMFFKEGPSIAKYEVLAKRASKAGLDVDDALDFLLAASFLDSAVGSLFYKEGEFFIDMVSIMNFLRSEEMAVPVRREKRRVENELQERRRLKTALKNAELAPEQVFELLNTPFGKERGVVMSMIYSLVKDPGFPADFGNNTQEILKRVNIARKSL